MMASPQSATPLSAHCEQKKGTNIMKPLTGIAVYDKAISDLNKGIEINPAHAGTYMSQGIAELNKASGRQE